MNDDPDRIERRIADLEDELASLKALRVSRSNANDWRGPSGDTDGDPFVLSSERELLPSSIAAWPDLAKLVLDALPIQVFLKRSEVEEGKGRKYLYLNKLARGALGWTEAEVVRSYDSDAFPSDQEGQSSFINMQKQESKTIISGRSQRTELTWLSRLGGMHQNITYEIPILVPPGEKGTAEAFRTIGFCAIGQDFVFRELPEQWAIFLRMFNHHYRNMSESLAWPLLQIQKAARQIRDSQSPSARAAMLATIEAEAIGVEQKLGLFEETSKLLYNALYSIAPPNAAAGTPGINAAVSDVVKSVTQAYKNGGLDFRCELDDDSIAATEIRQPAAIAGLLVILINNAAKHSETQVQRRECTIRCVRVDDSIVWRVSNPCRELLGRLNLEPDKDGLSAPSMDQAVHGGFDSFLIKRIIRHAFPTRTPEEVVIFPTSAKDGFVTVELRTGIANGPS